uniref:Peptidase M12B propeptide domain-containing protein n=1 Tax=Paramormyrops kingsleyae TaxID=1676925 RepID=A0A3B3RQN7_9TELE
SFSGLQGELGACGQLCYFGAEDLGSLCCSRSFFVIPSDLYALSDSSPDYVFVTPVEVDSLGGYISHDVVARSRQRRSLVPDPGPLHYRLSALGRDLHLDLRPSAVLADGFAVHTVGRGGVTTGRAALDIRGCFYQGFIRNHSASSIAVSTCTGLVTSRPPSPGVQSQQLCVTSIWPPT